MKQEYRCHGYPRRISGEVTFAQVLYFHSSHAELRVSSLDFVSTDRLFPPADSQQTQHLSSYQLTVPRPIGGRLRRDAEGRPPSQVSEVSTVSDCIPLSRALCFVLLTVRRPGKRSVSTESAEQSGSLPVHVIPALHPKPAASAPRHRCHFGQKQFDCLKQTPVYVTDLKCVIFKSELNEKHVKGYLISILDDIIAGGATVLGPSHTAT